MAENNVYKNDDLGVSFRLPEKMTVRQQIEMRSRVFNTDEGEVAAFRFWFGMLPFIEDWECEDYPEPNEIDVDKETDTNLTGIILWASDKMAEYYMDMGYVPKAK